MKKTINFDAPEAYHLYFGDEHGTPGWVLTWFEFVGVGRGRLGAGMVHTIEFGVGAEAALDFWAKRLVGRVEALHRSDRAVQFDDHEGLRFELVPAADGNAPLRAAHPNIPPEHAIVGIEGARAYAVFPADDAFSTQTLGFTDRGARAYRLDGERRRFDWAYVEAPPIRGFQGAGTVHHIAWASRDEDHVAWQQRVRAAAAYATDVRDRVYCRSIYFMEPYRTLFEIATISPGFAIDEDPEHPGEELRLPKMHAHLANHSSGR